MKNNKKIILKFLLFVVPFLALVAFGWNLALLFTALVTACFDYLSIIMLILDWLHIKTHLYFLYDHRPHPAFAILLAFIFLYYIIWWFFFQKK